MEDMSANEHLSSDQFLPAHVLRESYKPEPHELYLGLDSEHPRPAFHPDETENLRLHREWKLAEAKRLRYEDEPAGPDNQSLVDHVRDHGIQQPLLVDPRWHTIVDGNHHLEAAHAIDPDYPVPVKYLPRGHRVFPDFG